MIRVSRFEANLLRILHGILQRAPREQVLPLLGAPISPPPCLSKNALQLVHEALAAGTVVLLAREGWRRERHLHGNKVRDGRLWERHQPQELGLAYSHHSLAFLIGITALAPADWDGLPQPPPAELTFGDRLLFFFTYRLLHNTEAGASLARLPFMHRDGLCRLAFPGAFPAANADWGAWTTPVGLSVLECFQVMLAERWLETESHKRQVQDAAPMRQLGQEQEQLLSSFGDAMTAVGRRDLARFVLRAAGKLLAGNPSLQQWTAALDDRDLVLGDRLKTRRSALAFLGQLDPLQQWERQARSVGYFDEGYAAAQLWLEDWERADGDELCRRAQAVLRDAEPLGQEAAT